MKEETLKLIEAKVNECPDFTINGNDQTENMKNVLRLFAKDILSDPEIIASEGLFTEQDLQKAYCIGFLNQPNAMELCDEIKSRWELAIAFIKSLPTPPNQNI